MGRALPASDWITVTQDMIDQFAAATHDHQWIHVDVERARRESPYGSTIAHGYLTLSLLPAFRDKVAEFVASVRDVMPSNCHEMVSSQSQARGSYFSTSPIRLLWKAGM